MIGEGPKQAFLPNRPLSHPSRPSADRDSRPHQSAGCVALSHRTAPHRRTHRLGLGLLGLLFGLGFEFGFGWGLTGATSRQAFAQAYPGAADVPQTNLQPIGPPMGGTPFTGGGTGLGTGGGNGAFPGGPAAAGPPVGSTLFDPYATGAAAGGFSTPLAAPPGTVGPSQYPNGSFLGRLFSLPASSGSAAGGSVYGPPVAATPGAWGGSAWGGNATVTPPGSPGIAPYASTPGLPPPAFGGSGLGGPGFGGSEFGGSGFGGSGFGGSGFGSPGFPPNIYPSNTPSTLFPGGLFPQGAPPMFGGFGSASSPGQFGPFRFVHGPRLRHGTILGGNNNRDIGVNDTDVSVAFAFPNFLYSTQPLYVVPSFGLHLWDGPVSVGSTATADLPSAAYDGFLDFGWQSDPNQMFSAELGVRVGVFTDFDTFTSKSFRVRGKGLAAFRLTPASTFKLGVYYINRDNIKLLPAGGLLWQPSPVTRFDIFFPEPKFARYWTTIGRSDVWWYLAGDYGGGAWTIRRADGSTDSVDMSDIRVMLGLEWGESGAIRAGRRTAFAEVGMVFDRQVQFRFNRDDDFRAKTAVMFRLGLGY